MLKKVTRDKWIHFFGGIAMGLLLQVAIWYLLPMRPVLATGISFSIVVAVSYGFELFSLVTGKGHYEFMDAVAALIGGIIGIGLVLVFVAT